MAWRFNNPDMYPLYFGVWGILKTHIFAREPKTEIELSWAIRLAVAPPDPAVLTFEKRINICVENGGGHFEYKWKDNKEQKEH